MGIKSIGAKVLSKLGKSAQEKWQDKGPEIQEELLKYLLKKASETKFGKDHGFASIKNYNDYKKQVPIRDYEGLRPYIDKMVAGESNILWPGKPRYWAKTSGTTSGAKYIPISKESMPQHTRASKNMVLDYVRATGKSRFSDGGWIFVQGSPVLEETNGVKTGRLSGIVAHHVPKYLQSNRLPSFETNSIDDWEEKVEAIVTETMDKDMHVIAGIPPWLIMYFESLVKRSGKKVGELFPNFNLMVTGGVNYEPYRTKINELIGYQPDILQTYPASEGFIAYQNDVADESLLLLLDYGIYFEFVPLTEIQNKNPIRLNLSEVELDVDYAILLSTTAGLWAYNIGDTIRFTSLNPYKIVVSGRIKHYTSAFGEHVIAHEVESAMKKVIKQYSLMVNEFHVAPQVNPEEGLPFHEWFVAFEKNPSDIESIAKSLDEEMCRLNSYYNDLIKGKVLRPLVLRQLTQDAFNQYMKSQGKLGGQNKVPRLANDRKIADFLSTSCTRG